MDREGGLWVWFDRCMHMGIVEDGHGTNGCDG